MTKQAFINELKASLKKVPEEVCEEILSDIHEHFSEGTAQGLSEEEICQKLGQPGSIATQISEEYAGSASNIGNLNFDELNMGNVRIVNAKPGNVHIEYVESEDFQETEKIRGGYNISIDESFLGITDVDIELTGANIHFIPASDDKFRVVIKGRSRHNNFFAESKNGKLFVYEKRPKFNPVFFFSSPQNSLKATIFVPAYFEGEIKSDTAAGNIISENINGDLKLETAAGNVTVTEHRGNKINISTAAGNATAELLNNFVESVKISSAAGSAKITAKETGSLKISSAAGSVIANVTKLGETKISSAAGSLKLIAREVAGNVKISSAAGSAKIYLPVDVNCRIKTEKPAMGSLHNELTGNPNSPYTLKTSASMGSVKLLALKD
jgi:hypothetical protein